MVPQSAHSGSASTLAVLGTFYDSILLPMQDIFPLPILYTVIFFISDMGGGGQKNLNYSILITVYFCSERRHILIALPVELRYNWLCFVYLCPSNFKDLMRKII